MSQKTWPTDNAASRLKDRRAEVEAIRAHAKALFVGGATGIQVAAAISEATEQFVTRVFQETVDRLAPDRTSFVAKNVAVVAIGGTGRGELCPYSDVDLLFLVQPSARPLVDDCISQAVRDYWDAGLRLGHAVRGISDTLRLAREQIDVATALVEARLLFGSPGLAEQLTVEFQKKIVRPRLAA